MGVIINKDRLHCNICRINNSSDRELNNDICMVLFDFEIWIVQRIANVTKTGVRISQLEMCTNS